jgi:hypothetical protein
LGLAAERQRRDPELDRLPGRIVSQIGPAVRVVPAPGAELVEGFDPLEQAIVDEQVLSELAEVSTITAFSVEGEGRGSPSALQKPESLVQVVSSMAPLKIAPSRPTNFCPFLGWIVCWR